MKGVVIIALFAFVAVQLCYAAPLPDEDKKEAQSAAPVTDVSLADQPASLNAEAKSGSANKESSAAAAPTEKNEKVEEKKA